MLPIHGFAALMLLANTYSKNPLHFKNLEKPGTTLLFEYSEDNHDIHFIEAMRKKESNLPQIRRDELITINCAHQKNSEHISQMVSRDNREIYLKAPNTFKEISAATFNTIQSQINTILPLLRNGGKITIEWYPFCIFQRYYDAYSAPALLKDRNLSSDIEMNPFTGFFDLNICRPAIFFAINKQFPGHMYCPFFINEAKKLTPFVNKLLDSYATEQPAQRRALNRRLLLEIEILDQFEKYEKHGMKTVAISVLPGDSIEKFNDTVDHIIIPELGISYGLFTTFSRSEDMLAPHYRISRQEFIRCSLFYFVLSDLTVILQHKQAIKCLEDCGLSNVTIRRGVSPIDNRRNLWLLSGFKKHATTKQN